MPTALRWRHDQSHVHMLQNAHADHIEALYREYLSVPGNPKNVEIKTFGETRTFYADGEWLQNRAIFTGNETPEQFDEVLSHFIDKSADCVIEINPSNFYRTDPFSWDAEREDANRSGNAGSDPRFCPSR